MPDDKRFGVLWMGREALEAAFDLEGAFNDVSLALLRGADGARSSTARSAARPLRRRRRLRAQGSALELVPHERDRAAARRCRRILPTIFLGVAAFLTHMVLARLIAMERSEIGLLKAFGYGERDDRAGTT